MRAARFGLLVAVAGAFLACGAAAQAAAGGLEAAAAPAPAPRPRPRRPRHAMSTGQPVEQSSMAITFYNGEYAPLYGPISQCELLVRRAAKHGGKRIQFVPTHYWYDKDNEQYTPNTCHPDNWSLQNKADYYCYKHVWDSNCDPWNEGALNTFRTGFTNCLKVASQLFDEIMVAPHLDEGLKRGKWRNMFHFDPLWKDPHGYSYWDIMLEPILDAANAVLPAGKTFWFGVEGEMGGTIMSHPKQYLKIYDMIRKGWKTPAKLQVGCTVNHAYIMGYINRKAADIPVLPASPMAAFDGGWGPVLPFEQWPNYAEASKNVPHIKALLEASDFFGVSNYARAPDKDQVRASHIESGPKKVEAELAEMGISLKDLLSKKGVKFMYNEFGLGGGLSECGDVPGSDGRIGLFPWLGITTTYSADKDPFKKYPAAKEFLLKYYTTALKVLKAGGAEFPVHHSYIWNCVSWDVQGIHPASAAWNLDVDQGDWPINNGFAVKEVIELIKSHNAAINGKRREELDAAASPAN